MRARRFLLKQMIMRRVLLALLPCLAGAVYFFGWRSLALVLWSGVVGFFVEYLFTRLRGEPVTESVFVTTTILALIMPPTVPWHVLTMGVVFAVMFTKEIFGGFGRNFFNPAMAGRCFVYMCFPLAMTAAWSPAAEGTWGALDRWTTADGPDAITTATPMAHLKSGALVLVPEGATLAAAPFEIPEDQIVKVKRLSFWKVLFCGRLSGTMGATSVLLILIGGLYLFFTRTASRTIIVTVILTYGLLSQILNWAGIEPVPAALTVLLGGGWLFGAFFMATDPVSAPKTDLGKIFYAVIIGVCSVVIRNFSIFNGGLMFAILIGNMFAPILDHSVRAWTSGKAARPAKEGSPA
ncbi:MAG: RnfABCDGE type electron transport complex subunit D [Planctomycetes bacterium]|jgi:Na+-transporting NADH:ubiquinone oxidoreductase subunit B|nr:RnfABCDGE type electron transport complex subunit D [Planctomycetota bacterium]